MTADVVTPEPPLPDWSEICRQWLDCDVFLDTETTGLNDRAKIVELAVINGQGEALIDTLVKPAPPIPAEVTELHGITNDMVADAPTWWDIHRNPCRQHGSRHTSVNISTDKVRLRPVYRQPVFL